MCTNKVGNIQQKVEFTSNQGKKEKEGKVLKYFHVENGVMSFMELKRKKMRVFQT